MATSLSSSMTGIFVHLPMNKFKVLGETFKNVLNSFDGLARKFRLLEAKTGLQRDTEESTSKPVFTLKILAKPK